MIKIRLLIVILIFFCNDLLSQQNNIVLKELLSPPYYFYGDSVLFEEITMTLDSIIITKTTYYSSGGVCSLDNYKFGYKNGYCYDFKPDGTKVATAFYRIGQLIFANYFDEDGDANSHLFVTIDGECVTEIRDFKLDLSYLAYRDINIECPTSHTWDREVYHENGVLKCVYRLSEPTYEYIEFNDRGKKIYWAESRSGGIIGVDKGNYKIWDDEGELIEEGVKE